MQAWRPYLRKDIDMLEQIQRRATKHIPGLRDFRYEERLKESGLTTLETQRLRGIKIEVFKAVFTQRSLSDLNLDQSKFRSDKVCVNTLNRIGKPDR